MGMVISGQVADVSQRTTQKGNAELALALRDPEGSGGLVMIRHWPRNGSPLPIVRFGDHVDVSIRDLITMGRDAVIVAETITVKAHHGGELVE